jgi:hypothetical protein
MAIIPQISMFSWENDINNLGDLERLRLALESMPDEGLMRFLEKRRGKGRNDFPVRALWNMQIAKIVFGHVSFGFEERTVRGLSKMILRYTLALSVMNAMAVGRIKQNRNDLMRSLVKAA